MNSFGRSNRDNISHHQPDVPSGPYSVACTVRIFLMYLEKEKKFVIRLRLRRTLNYPFTTYDKRNTYPINLCLLMVTMQRKSYDYLSNNGMYALDSTECRNVQCSPESRCL